ncbi:MAG: Ig domain-containing protein [Limisphaerales bacterium]
MLQSLKKLFWILLLVSVQQAAWAFALLGPLPNYTNGVPPNFGDDWQVSTIGYDYPGSGDIGGPKNIGEEYRRNAQVYYYACNQNFLDFFGSNGVVAIDQAFSIMNDSLTNVDSFSPALTEFPLVSQSINYDASGLDLTDLKSITLGALVENMGLAGPVRFAWTLHDRYLPGGAQCPAYEYLVVQRNFDTTASPLNQAQYSPYINGTLYTYYIDEVCPASVPDPQAVAVPVQADALQNSFTAVAGMHDSLVLRNSAFINAGLQLGGFYTGLTRDDVAGLRYLLTTNNINFETPTFGSVLVNSSGPGGTNYGQPFVLFTSNYNAFAAIALTNDPVTLSNLYPGLIITSSPYSFVPKNIPIIVLTTNNLIGAPAGTQVLGIRTNGFTQTYVTQYKHTYGNLIVPAGFSSTNKNTTGSIVTITVSPASGAPAGTLITNISAVPVILSGVPSGDYYIATNVCGPDLILSNLLTIKKTSSTVLYSISNSAGLSYTQYLITTNTTHALVALPIVCGAVSGGGGTNAPALYQGIGKVQFVKTSYDSWFGQFYQPLTNTYTQYQIANSKLVKQTFQRVVTTPDFLMSAVDLSPGPAALIDGTAFTRNINFDLSNILPGLAGPGTINPFTQITYNKAGNDYINVAGGNEQSQFVHLAWASFDGSTNAPILYPNGTSIENLANQILVQLTPSSLPVGTNHVAYPATTFVATGGAFFPPFTWSLTGGGLPPGLTLSPGGTISGTPTQTGTFDFNVRLTDSLSRTVTWSFAITIN